MAYQELLPLLPGMSLSVVPGGSAADLAIVRTLTETLDGSLLNAVRAELAALERVVAQELLPLLDVQLHAAGITVVYPWRDGLPLAGALARAREAGLLPPIRVAGRMVQEAVGALAALHAFSDENGVARPLMHGAFRADSLWLGFDGRLQLCDAGYASVTSRLEQPAYAVRDARADVQAAGVLAYVVLTGVMPAASAEGADPSQVNPEVPEEVAAVVKRATHPDATQRFADARELKDAWEAALAAVGGLATQSQVSRWLWTIFPSNHPLVAALRTTLTPFGGGALLPTAEGPLLSNPRLAPVPSTSTPRAQPVVDPPAPSTSTPRAQPVVDAPVPSTSAPRAQPVVDAPVPPTSTPRAPPVTDPPVQTTSTPRAQPVGEPMGQPAPEPPTPAAADAPTVEAAVPAIVPPWRVETAADSRVEPQPPEPPVAAAAEPAPSESPTPAASEAPTAEQPVPSLPAAPTAFVTPAAPAPSPAPVEPAPVVSTPRAQPVVDAPSASPAAPARQRTATGKRPRVRTQPTEPLDIDNFVDDIRPPPAKSSSRAIVLTLVGALVGGSGVFAALQFTQKQPAAAVSPADDPLAAVESPPLEAAAPPKPAPEKPAPAKKAAPAPAPKKKPAKRVSRAAAPDDDDPDVATLSLNVTPWAIVWVDGKKVGRTPLKPLKLRPGRHTIRMENPEWRVKRTDTVDLQAGGWGELSVAFTPPGN